MGVQKPVTIPKGRPREPLNSVFKRKIGDQIKRSIITLVIHIQEIGRLLKSTASRQVPKLLFNVQGHIQVINSQN